MAGEQRGGAPRQGTVDGYHARHWTQDGFAFWAVSDLNESWSSTSSFTVGVPTDTLEISARIIRIGTEPASSPSTRLDSAQTSQPIRSRWFPSIIYADQLMYMLPCVDLQIEVVLCSNRVSEVIMRRLVVFVVNALFVLVASSSAIAGLIGQEFTVEYNYPELDQSYGSASIAPTSFIVGAGVETTIDIEGLLAIAVDFDDSSIAVQFNKLQPYSSQWLGANFNGLVFTLVGPGPLGIATVDLTPSSYMPGFDASRVTVTANSIAFNWQGLAYDVGNPYRDGDGTAFSARLVPEPGTLVLLGGGLLMLGAGLRQGHFSAAAPGADGAARRWRRR